MVKLRYLMEYATVMVIRAMVRLLPFGLVPMVGTTIGLVFYGIDRGHRRLAIANLRAAFPHRSPAECRALARRTFRHFGRLLTALLKFSTMTPDEMRTRVEFAGAERVEDAHALGRGVLLFTGHFGYWELNALVHALRLPPLAVLARALDNPHLHALLERVRTRTGNSVIYRRGAVRRVLRVLGANGTVAMLIDQHIQSADAIVVEFFDRPAATTSALAAIAARTGAPVIPVFALPLSGGRYRMVYEHPVPPPASDDPAALRDFMQRCTDVLEMYVRRYPDLWLWMHRRWRDLHPAIDGVPGMFPAASRNGTIEH
ncbi:MAG TPA: lysophospholipid acyltransferase family protein [Vicinamibacterales bacterium]|nr:lysophospholipid acyltransferase family protein [Vicinamibacterales bacterium]